MPLCLSSYRAGFVNPYSSVRVRPGAPFECRMKSRMPNAKYGMQKRAQRRTAEVVVKHLDQDCGVISSISAREADGPGANPGFLTKRFLDGPKLVDYAPPARR